MVKFPFWLHSILIMSPYVYICTYMKTPCLNTPSVKFEIVSSDYSQQELQELLDKAEHFQAERGSGMRELHWFYRNKDMAYFNTIFLQQCGWMTKYRKNNNGDPASPINRKLDGLNFSVMVDPVSGEPPLFSHFGQHRIHIPAGYMFFNFPNLYFSDFYCHYHSHHMTLVMTRQGSKADDFCSKNLVKLNASWNPFLWYNLQANRGTVSSHIQIEILVTEDIDLNDVKHAGGYFGNVLCYTNPCPSGRRKSPSCRTCNLYLKQTNGDSVVLK